MKLSIAPSLIAHSQAELEKNNRKISSLKPSAIHLDIMDGDFVEHTSLEFDFKLPKGNYEAHLMVSDPHSWMLAHHKKVKTIMVHYESKSHIHALIKSSHMLKKKIGIAIKPETPLDDVVQYLPHIDKLLIMTVKPGRYGASFLPEVIGKIRHARRIAPKLDIEVDGGITPKTISLCKHAGANQFVVGSFLQNSPDIPKAWKELQRELIR